MLARLAIRALPLLVLTACTPHPGAGKWQAMAENEAGITDLTLAFDGRALFATSTPKASWHCFWSAQDAANAILDCTPSSNPDQEVRWLFRVDRQGEGRLERDGRLVARFRRVEGKPEIPQ